jgi:predicted  nucleic acid-binding Zn-ribbon protein
MADRQARIDKLEAQLAKLETERDEISAKMNEIRQDMDEQLTARDAEAVLEGMTEGQVNAIAKIATQRLGADAKGVSSGE